MLTRGLFLVETFETPQHFAIYNIGGLDSSQDRYLTSTSLTESHRAMAQYSAGLLRLVALIF